MTRVYIASKCNHAHEWRRLRDRFGANIISTWIDEAGQGESKSIPDLASRCIREASSCDLLILYSQPGEILKGALWEAGAAISHGRSVIAVGSGASDSPVLLQHPLAARWHTAGYRGVWQVLDKVGAFGVEVPRG